MFGKAFGICLLWLAIAVSYAAGQSNNQAQAQEGYAEGRFNVWTTGTVFRENIGKAADDVKIRVGTHKGYDRIVFELKGDLPTFSVAYQTLPFELYDSSEIYNVRGKAFMEITFIPFNYSEKNYNTPVDLKKSSQPNLRTPLISDFRSLGWFEGEIRYAIGLKARRPFRVQVLSNPTRLVIDFKS